MHAKNPRHSVVRFRVKCVGDGPGQTASYLQQNMWQTYHNVWTCTPSTRVCSRARGTLSGSQHPYRCPTWWQAGLEASAWPSSTYVDPPAGDRCRAYCSCRLGYGRWSWSLEGATTRRRSSGPVSEWASLKSNWPALHTLLFTCM